MSRLRRGLTLVTALSLVAALGTEALAHWCSNIWTGATRLVVKPEKSSLAVPSGSSTQLRVYLQNNFPYRLYNVQMRGQATGYTIAVSPAQNIQPGQNVSYVFTVSGTAGSVPVTTLNLQVLFRVGSWRGATDWLVKQDPTQANLVSSSTYGGGNAQQAPSLNAATLADLYPSATLPATAPTFGRTAVQQLINMFGYRFCYDTGGGWRSGSANCPTPTAEGGTWSGIDQFPQDCMRAGIELGIRRASLGSNLNAARLGANNSMKAGGSAQHKCVGAVVGAYLWQGASDYSSFTSAMTSGGVPATCVTAAQRILGTATSCSGGTNYQERAACAAAEGLQGNDGPVNSVLKPGAGDGERSGDAGTGVGDMESLYYAYMLSLVSGHRRATAGSVSYYPDAGAPTASCTGPADCNDNNVCTTDVCNTGTGVCTNAAITGCCTTSAQCNDSNVCTTDTCNTSTNTCTNAAITGCCTASAQCNDSNVCTTDTCNTTSHTCQFAPITNCCTDNAQCNDSSNCTTDSCNTTTNTCVHTPLTGCCTVPADCSDSNVCTSDVCNTTDGTCSNPPITGCCTASTQCNDSNVCTTDTCNTTSHTCQFAPITGCCTTNAGCNDSNACTADTCNTTSHTCQNTAITGCCTTNAQCNDSSACTTDTCNTTSHTCQHAPIAGCCTGDAACADSNPCTDDKCDTSTGSCSNTKRTGCCAFDVDCDDSDGCTLDTCDTTANTCSHAQSCVDQGVTPREAGAADGFKAGDQKGQTAGGGTALSGGCAVAQGAGPGSKLPLALLGVLAAIGWRRRRRARR